MLPLALRLILFTLFLPVELSLFIAGLRVTLTRLIFLALAPAVFVRLGSQIAAGRYRFVMSDLFVFLAALWMFIGTAATSGSADALEHSGPVALEFLIAYLSTRLLLPESAAALRFTSLLCLMIFFVVLDALLDTVTGKYFTHEFLGSLTGMHYVVYNEDSYRLGLLRAAGTIEHPIGFGFTSAVGLLLAAAVRIRWRGLCIVVCGLGVVISISSAPHQSAFMGLALLAYSRLFPDLRRKWLLLSIAPTVLATSLFLSTPTPFGHLFEYFTIDSTTAYYRLYIWNVVGPAILQNPFFAVLDTSYDYEGSVDSLWLVLSLAYGMPCAILVALSMIGCGSLPTNGPSILLSVEEARLGTILGIILFLVIFMSFTVDFWGEVWIMIGLLIGMRARLGELGRLNVVVAESAEHFAELSAAAAT